MMTFPQISFKYTILALRNMNAKYQETSCVYGLSPYISYYEHYFQLSLSIFIAVKSYF